MKLLQIDKTEFINSDAYIKKQISIDSNVLDSILDCINDHLLNKQVESPTTKKKQANGKKSASKRWQKTLLQLARYQSEYLKIRRRNINAVTEDEDVHAIKTIAKRLKLTEQTIRNRLTKFANEQNIIIEKGKFREKIPQILSRLVDQYPDSQLENDFMGLLRNTWKSNTK